MTLPQIPSQQYQVEALTEHYLFNATMEPTGTFIAYLDQPNRANLQLKDVTITPLDNDSAVEKIQVGELWARSDEIIAMRVLNVDIHDMLTRLPQKENLRVFLPRFVVQATFSHGVDTKLSEMFEVVKGIWVAGTEARIYPLVATRAPVFTQAPLILLNRHHINFYESIAASS